MKYVYTDTETTGLNPPRRVIEVGWALIPGEGMEAFQEMTLGSFRVRPTPAVLAEMEPGAAKVNGYYDGHPDWVGTPYLDTPEAAALWGQLCDTFTGVSLRNQNIQFDKKFILYELRMHKILVPGAFGVVQPPWAPEEICTRPMAKRFQMSATVPGLTGSLHPIYDYLQGPPLPPHRSLSDVLRAIWLHACYLEVFERQDVRPMKDAFYKHYKAEFGTYAPEPVATETGC